MAKKEKKSSGVTKLIGGWLMKKMAIGGAKQLRSNADEVNSSTYSLFPTVIRVTTCALPSKAVSAQSKTWTQTTSQQ